MQQSYYFPDGREPYDWAMETMKAAYRHHKHELKSKFCDGKTVEQALASKPDYMPDDMWRTAILFWNSEEGRVKLYNLLKHVQTSTEIYLYFIVGKKQKRPRKSFQVKAATLCWIQELCTHSGRKGKQKIY